MLLKSIVALSELETWRSLYIYRLLAVAVTEDVASVVTALDAVTGIAVSEEKTVERVGVGVW